MFDLYFAGTRQSQHENYLIEHSANRLFSQVLDRANIKYWIEHKKDNSKIFIDSGAYTAYTKGKQINVDDYIDFLNSITDKVTIFAQLDKIPGQFRKPKTLQDILNAPELSWKNYLYMRESKAARKTNTSVSSRRGLQMAKKYA